jgi:hypothetical protein
VKVILGALYIDTRCNNLKLTINKKYTHGKNSIYIVKVFSTNYNYYKKIFYITLINPEIDRRIMKFLKIFVIGAIITGMAACKKAQLTNMDAPNDDAAIIIAEALATNNYGAKNITQDISDKAIELASKSNTFCGISVTDSVSRKSTLGTNFSYNYKLNYTHKLNCNTSNLPDNIIGSLTYSGKFTGPKLISNYNGSRTYRIAGLTPAGDKHIFNGEYKCYNNYKFKTDTTNKGNANIYFGVKDLMVSKADHSIISGSAMIMITGSSSKKANFTYNGTLIFSSSTATLKLNGDEYNIDINTGNVVKK